MARARTPPVTLISPEPVAAVPQSQASGISKRDGQESTKLERKVIEFTAGKTPT
jgi:hypothetical protein